MTGKVGKREKDNGDIYLYPQDASADSQSSICHSGGRGRVGDIEPNGFWVTAIVTGLYRWAMASPICPTPPRSSHCRQTPAVHNTSSICRCHDGGHQSHRLQYDLLHHNDTLTGLRQLLLLLCLAALWLHENDLLWRRRDPCWQCLHWEMLSMAGVLVGVLQGAIVLVRHWHRPWHPEVCWCKRRIHRHILWELMAVKRVPGETRSLLHCQGRESMGHRWWSCHIHGMHAQANRHSTANAMLRNSIAILRLPCD